tara:strand:+ start:570 stop:770 length:201 start_codon:yes stop_codon:yes gene_type:complete
MNFRKGKLVWYRNVGFNHKLALIIRGPFEKLDKNMDGHLEIVMSYDIFVEGKLICDVPKKYLRTIR